MKKKGGNIEKKLKIEKKRMKRRKATNIMKKNAIEKEKNE